MQGPLIALMDRPKRAKEVIRHLRLGIVESICSLFMHEGLRDKRNPETLGALLWEWLWRTQPSTPTSP